MEGHPDPIELLIGYLDDVLSYSAVSTLPISAYAEVLKSLETFKDPEDEKDPECKELTEKELCTACDHLLLNDRIFTRLQYHNFKIKISKLKMFQDESKTLGVLINKDGIEIDPKRMEKILATPMPSNLKEMQGYCGFLSSIGLYTNNHVSQQHAILAELTSEKRKFVIEEKHKDAFEESKRLLTSSPTFIHYPNQYAPKLLFVDASDILLGAVLLDISLPKISLSDKPHPDNLNEFRTMEMEKNRIIEAAGIDGIVIPIPHKTASSLFESTIYLLEKLGLGNLPTQHKLLRQAVLTHLESSAIKYTLAKTLLDSGQWGNFLKTYEHSNSGWDNKDILKNGLSELLERQLIFVREDGTVTKLGHNEYALQKPRLFYYSFLDAITRKETCLPIY